MPPGELHAIGARVFLLELQQPEDLSILLEWHGFALDGQRDGHLGLGFDLALQAVNTQERSPAELDRWMLPAGEGHSILPPDSAPYFRLDRHVVDGSIDIEPGFAIIVVEEGEVKLTSAAGHSRRGAARQHDRRAARRGRDHRIRIGNRAGLPPAAPLTRRTSR